MAVTSAQISGLIGGQHAMFSNQALFSQQIGGAVGTNPFPSGAMQSPYPSGPSYGFAPQPMSDAGARMAGGVGMAVPGITAGASIAGGFMGGRMAMMDPFTMGARGFASGSGVAGGGFWQTMGHVGRTFAQGGLRAGVGAIGGGVAGAAMAALPVAAGIGAINAMGENIWRGAQNVAEVGQLSGHFGSQFGGAGARGGAMGRGQIGKIVNIMHEMVGEDAQTTMDSLKKLMDDAGRMGMLTGVTSAEQFKTRFTKVVDQVRGIAKVLGTSLDEAMPLFGQAQRMGLWTASDVMGTAIAGRVTGQAGTPAMLGAMQSGAQMSHAMGGRMGAGAVAGREMFLGTQAAVRAGVLSNQDIREFTGGLGGAEGMSAMAQRLTSMTSRFGQTAAGSMMLAGLGQTEGGEFTGRMDSRRLQQFLRGEIPVEELQRMGRRATGTKEAAGSFQRRRGALGQELSAQAGVEGIAQIVQNITDTRFGGSKNMRHHLFRQMAGVNDMEAELLGKFADELPRIMDQRSRETEAAIEDSFRRLRERTEQSWDGMKEAAGQAWTDAMRPFQTAGEHMATAFGEAGDKISSMWWGRTRHISMGAQERIRLLQQPGGQSWGARGGMNANLMTGDMFEDTMATRLRRAGGGFWGAVGSGAIAGAGVGAIAGAGVGVGVGMLVGGAIGGAGALMGGGGRRADVMRALNLGEGATRTDIMGAIRGATRRARGISAADVGAGSGATVSRRRAFTQVRASLREVVGRNFTRLSKMKESDPLAYSNALMRMVREKDPAAFDELRRSGVSDLDILAAAQQEEGFSGGAAGADFRKVLSEMGYPSGTPDQLKEAQSAAVEKMHAATEGFMGWDRMSTGEIEEIMTGEHAGMVNRWLKGEVSDEEIGVAAARDPTLGKLVKSLDTEGRRRDFREGAGVFGAARFEQARMQGVERLQAVARDHIRSGDIRGLRSGTGARFDEMIEAYGGGNVDAATRMAEGLAGDITDVEARALESGRGGSFGAQVGALRRIGRAGPMTAGQTKRFMTRLQKASGVGLKSLSKPMQARLTELMESGISSGEAEEFRDILGTGAKTAVAESGGGRRSATQRLAEEMSVRAIDANVKFVNAVNQALGEGTLAASAKELVDAEESRKATPNVRA